MRCTFSSKARYAFIDSDLKQNFAEEVVELLCRHRINYDSRQRILMFSRPLKRTQPSFTGALPTDKSVGYFQPSAEADSTIIYRRSPHR